MCDLDSPIRQQIKQDRSAIYNCEATRAVASNKKARNGGGVCKIYYLIAGGESYYWRARGGCTKIPEPASWVGPTPMLRYSSVHMQSSSSM